VHDHFKKLSQHVIKLDETILLAFTETVSFSFLFEYTWFGFYLALGFTGGSEVKVSACNVEDPGLIPVSGRSPGEGNGSPLQYSCLENPMEEGAW